MPKFSLSTTDLAAYAGLIASLIAVVSAIASCQISRSALHISTLEYNNSRTLILRSEVIDGTKKVKLSSHDPAFLLQEVYYKFPSEISKSKKYVSAPDYVIDLSEEIDQYNKDKVIIGENARMPFLIETYSSTKGQSFRSTALYTLNFRFEIGESSDREPSITLTGVTFGSRVETGEKGEALIEQEWKSIRTQ